MNEFLTNNWFNFVTLLIIAGGFLVNFGMSKQRGVQIAGTVTKLEALWKTETLRLESYFKGETDALRLLIGATTHALDVHVGNSETHVNSMFLELLRTRHEFVIQQQAETRADVQRVEQQLARNNGSK